MYMVPVRVGVLVEGEVEGIVDRNVPTSSRLGLMVIEVMNRGGEKYRVNV